ncbi:hypothetical protein DSECCO2_601790 [anaerobic digester metagenome]
MVVEPGNVEALFLVPQFLPGRGVGQLDVAQVGRRSEVVGCARPADEQVGPVAQQEFEQEQRQQQRDQREQRVLGEPCGNEEQGEQRRGDEAAAAERGADHARRQSLRGGQGERGEQRRDREAATQEHVMGKAPAVHGGRRVVGTARAGPVTGQGAWKSTMLCAHATQRGCRRGGSILWFWRNVANF